jgi:hypothetical protein
MGDDIVTIGGPERGPRRWPGREPGRDAEGEPGRGAGREPGRGSGETLESLFAVHYAGLVHVAFAQVGDWHAAETITMRAYARLSSWWRWRLMPDADAALLFLEDAIADLASAGSAPGDSGRIGADDSGGELSDDAEPDAGLAWPRFLELQSRTKRTSRRRLAIATAGVVAVAAVAGGVAIVAGAGPGAQVTANHGPGPRGRASAVIGIYSGALVAGLPLGGVVDVTHSGSNLWLVRQATQSPAGDSFQLVEVDPRTNKVLLRVSLGPHRPAVVAGGGRLWLTTAFGQRGGRSTR